MTKWPVHLKQHTTRKTTRRNRHLESNALCCFYITIIIISIYKTVAGLGFELGGVALSTEGGGRKSLKVLTIEL